MKEFIKTSEREIYYGELDGSGQFYHGVGLKLYPNGDIFYGNWKHGEYDGYGAYVYYNGQVRICNWSDGEPIDEGIVVKPEGDPFLVYFGTSENTKPKSGIGLHRDGKIFAGEWTNWNGDVFDGKGTFSWPDGRIYSGFWKNSRQDNGGVIVRVDGTISGTFDDKALEDNTLLFKNDSKRLMFYGSYRDESVRNGKGVTYYSDKSIYSGDNVNGARSGFGFYKYPDGSVYIGDWKHDKENGKGILYTPGKDAELYVGDFSKGSFDGDGCVFSVKLSGTTVKHCGEWEKGLQISDWKSVISKPQEKEAVIPPTYEKQSVQPAVDSINEGITVTEVSGISGIPIPKETSEVNTVPLQKEENTQKEEKTQKAKTIEEPVVLKPEQKSKPKKSKKWLILVAAALVLGIGIYRYIEDNAYPMPEGVVYDDVNHDSEENKSDVSFDNIDTDTNSESDPGLNSDLQAGEESLTDSDFGINKDNGKYDLTKFTRAGDVLQYEDDVYASRMGIDVSYYQGQIDWQKVKDAGIEFAYIRLGYRGYGEAGSINTDKLFEENIKNAQAAGIDVGVYFFSQSINEEEAREEADFILQTLKSYSVDLPIAIEAMTKMGEEGRTNNLRDEQIARNTKAFCEAILSAGYEPLIAFNSSQLSAYEANAESLSEYAVWYGDYELNSQPPFLCQFFQYANNGSVPGIDTKVDLDIQFIKK